MAKHVYSYVRFSTDEQMQGDSLRRQTQLRDDLCRRRGWTLDESLTIRDLGVSAFRGKNVEKGALSVFLKAVEEGRVPKGSILIVESLDRLTRMPVKTALRLFLNILEAGVNIQTLDPERLHTADSANEVVGLIEPIVIMSRANEESRTKSNRIKERWAEKRREAQQGTKVKKRLRSWLTWDKDAKDYKVVKEYADRVRLVFKLALKGLGQRAIAEMLKEKGVKAFRQSEGPWSAFMVTKLLHDRAVLGEYQPMGRGDDGKKCLRGAPIPSYFPAIVSEEDFYKVQAGLKQRWPGGGGAFTDPSRNLFSNLLWTPEGKMLLRDKVKEAIVYRTRGAGALQIRVSVFEEAYLKWAEELTLDDKAPGQASDKAAELQVKLDDLQRRLDKLSAEIETTPDMDLLLSWAKQLESEKKATQAALMEARPAVVDPASSLDKLKALLARLRKAKGDELKRVRLEVKARIAEVVQRIEMASMLCHGWGRRVMGTYAEITLKDGRHRKLFFVSQQDKLLTLWTQHRHPGDAEGGSVWPVFESMLKGLEKAGTLQFNQATYNRSRKAAEEQRAR